MILVEHNISIWITENILKAGWFRNDLWLARFLYVAQLLYQNIMAINIRNQIVWNLFEYGYIQQNNIVEKTNDIWNKENLDLELRCILGYEINLPIHEEG